MSYRLGASHGRPGLLAVRIASLAVLAVMLVGLTASAQVAPQALGIVKTSSKALVRAEEVFTYTITMLNSGPGNVSVTMTDVLPFGVLFVPHSLTPGATYAAGTVSWTGVLYPGVPQSVSFRVLVYEPGTIGPLPIVNTACMTDGSAPICRSVTVMSLRWAIFLPIMSAHAGS
jgi:uncharacterized repeat protein (TIGR01451 family)